MAQDKNNEQTDWQKNAGRPSNFHEKDDKLKKDKDGNLKIKKDQEGVSKEDDKMIEETLDSLNNTDNEEEK